MLRKINCSNNDSFYVISNGHVLVTLGQRTWFLDYRVTAAHSTELDGQSFVRFGINGSSTLPILTYWYKVLIIY
jgi:hypothetical protein